MICLLHVIHHHPLYLACPNVLSTLDETSYGMWVWFIESCVVFTIYLFIYLYVRCNGFSGLGIACWPLVPKFAGSNPAKAVGFLRAKKSSARLPSEGK